MTGYGAGRADAPTARVTVEMRSVNQRFLDVKIVAPHEYAAWEREVRDRVRAVAQRGRVEVTVARAALAARRRYAVAVRAELADAYVAAARQLGRRLGLGGDVALTDVLRLPDVLEVSEQPPEPRGELAALRRAPARGRPPPARHARPRRLAQARDGGHPPPAAARPGRAAQPGRGAPGAPGGRCRARSRPGGPGGRRARRPERRDRGAGTPRSAPGRARHDARRARPGRQADRVPAPGDPARAQYHRRQGG